jgi:hypothetical protein
MQPNHFDLLGHGRDGAGDTRQQLSRDTTSRSESAAQRLRSEGMALLHKTTLMFLDVRFLTQALPDL